MHAFAVLLGQGAYLTLECNETTPDLRSFDLQHWSGVCWFYFCNILFCIKIMDGTTQKKNYGLKENAFPWGLLKYEPLRPREALCSPVIFGGALQPRIAGSGLWGPSVLPSKSRSHSPSAMGVQTRNIRCGKLMDIGGRSMSDYGIKKIKRHVRLWTCGKFTKDQTTARAVS